MWDQLKYVTFSLHNCGVRSLEFIANSSNSNHNFYPGWSSVDPYHLILSLPTNNVVLSLSPTMWSKSFPYHVILSLPPIMCTDTEASVNKHWADGNQAKLLGRCLYDNGSNLMPCFAFIIWFILLSSGLSTT